jgi:hypothetical protein
MSNTSLYHLKQPTAWPENPDLFSFSSLMSIDTCPLQWQLIHSTYGDVHKFPARPNPSAVEGTIVHHVLDELFKKLAFEGLPELGSPEFAEAIASVNITGKVEALISEHENQISKHPRGGGCRLRTGTQQIVNQVIRLFRAEYPKAKSNAAAPPKPLNVSSLGSAVQLLPLLRERGALSEVRLAHPKLPFEGIIDLVRIDNEIISVVDFKTGAPKPTHRDQLLLYAVLWWRKTEALPKQIEVRYLSGTEVLTIDAPLLDECEHALAGRIDAVRSVLSSAPAIARVGEHCQYCDVRQFCPDYWINCGEESLDNKTKIKNIDIELTIKGHPGSNGFLAVTSNGSPCTVVYSSDGNKVHGPFSLGEKLRVLKGRITEEGTIEFLPWTEVFHL